MMATADPQSPGSGEPTGSGFRPRIGRVFAGSRELIRIAYRDPEHISERLTLYAIDRLADPSTGWAQSTQRIRPDLPRAEIAEELRMHTAQVARIDGAISGTPFLIALVPGYLTYLWQEMHMTMRTAALYGRDLGSLRTAAEMLALRGVHSDVGSAEAALLSVKEQPMPGRPTQRRSLRAWVHCVIVVLVFGGFLSPSDGKPPPTGWRARLLAALGLLMGAVIWAMTWVLPVTLMIVMAWGCETHARQLGRRALVYYDGQAASISAAIALAGRRRDRGHDKRAVLRSVALFLSVALPAAFVALVGRVRNTAGFSWLTALGALVAVSLVILTAVISSRR
jgi:hypothetical protein